MFCGAREGACGDSVSLSDPAGVSVGSVLGTAGASVGSAAGASTAGGFLPVLSGVLLDLGSCCAALDLVQTCAATAPAGFKATVTCCWFGRTCKLRETAACSAAAVFPPATVVASIPPSGPGTSPASVLRPSEKTAASWRPLPSGGRSWGTRAGSSCGPSSSPGAWCCRSPCRA